MIAHFTKDTKTWSPENFARYEEYYPQTQWTAADYALERSTAFKTAWKEQLHIPKSTSLVLTPGLFAEWVPQCFRGPRKGFLKQGHRTLQTPVATRFDVNTQAKRIEATICKWLQPDEQFIWCTHSKGGIDALWALEHSTRLQEHCSAVVVFQLPVGYSWVIEDLQHARSIADRITRKAMTTRWLRDGILTITKDGDAAVNHWLRTHKPKVPVLQVVSWSTKPTNWADSWHKRLSRVRPQHAHDGQVFLQDQCLADLPIICLPELDHAQPVLGGNNLDTRRLWHALAHTAHMESKHT